MIETTNEYFDGDFDLSPHHLAMLRDESGICDEVIAERGYRTVTDKKELEGLGFKPYQQHVPALLFPLYGVAGEVEHYVLRPDIPRTRNKKPVKYDNPKDVPNRLDVHPFSFTHIDNPAVPLFITEGIKKADSIVSRGGCSIALSGVWNWRGTNDKGGKVALPDFHSVALNGRDIYLVFDSDAFTNINVNKAVRELGGFLSSKGAKVKYITVPYDEK